MKKATIIALPKLFEGTMTPGAVTFSNIEPMEDEYVKRKLSVAELKNIENIASFLEANCIGRANALWNLAVCYDCGISTDTNMDKSKNYYMLAHMQELLDEGQFADFNESAFNCVNLIDCAQAYEKAAINGCPCAMFFYGLSYLNGLGVDEDDGRATYWFEKASGVGLDEATNALANNYLRGYGVAKNIAKAVELLQISAEHGNADGLYTLGAILCNAGLKSEGLIYIRKAASKGHKQAKAVINEL